MQWKRIPAVGVLIALSFFLCFALIGRADSTVVNDQSMSEASETEINVYSPENYDMIEGIDVILKDGRKIRINVAQDAIDQYTVQAIYDFAVDGIDRDVEVINIENGVK